MSICSTQGNSQRPRLGSTIKLLWGLGAAQDPAVLFVKFSQISQVSADVATSSGLQIGRYKEKAAWKEEICVYVRLSMKSQL
jgi:hypothetical protein